MGWSYFTFSNRFRQLEVSHELKHCSAVYNDMKTGFIAIEYPAEVELQQHFVLIVSTMVNGKNRDRYKAITRNVYLHVCEW